MNALTISKNLWRHRVTGFTSFESHTGLGPDLVAVHPGSIVSEGTDDQIGLPLLFVSATITGKAGCQTVQKFVSKSATDTEYIDRDGDHSSTGSDAQRAK
ncbi:hypothetical protein AbraIFM66950_007181 [Aspergillus brasiliensis]|nr:hypothetical protein AbraIFM66950_007181 [Aspergillus brasiliensis]